MENNGNIRAFSLLKDEVYNRQLLENGFVHIPFLTEQEVSALKALYINHYGNDKVEGLYVSAFKGKREIMQVVSDASSAIFERACNLHLNEVHKLGGAFIAKDYDPENVLHAHQDWSIVDEALHRSYTIWVPLQDIDETNGAMHVLPGSHNWVRGYRHITIPSVYGKVYDLAWKYSLPIYMKAGEALIFDHALAHSSRPNCSSELRIVATQGFVSKGAEMRIYLNADGIVEEYACGADYYLEPSAQAGPHPFPKMKDTNFKPIQLSEADFLTFVKSNRQLSQRKDSFFGRLISFWLQK